MYMEQSTQPFNLTIFTEDTKNICLCTAAAIFIIILFVVSPLSNFFKTSLLMKAVAMRLMVYILFLNYTQTNLLRAASSVAESEAIRAQLDANIMCSYVFSFFIGLLAIFTLKSIIITIMNFFGFR
jgi:uncharacterized membrane protein YdbT with pleckstrin-like domain